MADQHVATRVTRQEAITKFNEVGQLASQRPPFHIGPQTDINQGLLAVTLYLFNRVNALEAMLGVSPQLDVVTESDAPSRIQ